MILPTALLISPFLFQGALMFFDEFYYHKKRGLPQWEVWGHPLDTLTVFACYYFVFNFPMTHNNILIYIGLVTLSCLFVSKDEFVHAKECDPGEQWLHSILFILHPITLGVLGFMWPILNENFTIVGTSNLMIVPSDVQLIQNFIKGQVGLILIFMTYQITYWGIPWKKLLQKH